MRTANIISFIIALVIVQELVVAPQYDQTVANIFGWHSFLLITIYWFLSSVISKLVELRKNRTKESEDKEQPPSSVTYSKGEKVEK